MADSTTLQAAAYTAQGTPRERVTLPGATFDGTVNVPAMHLAVKAYLANQRQGTHATKTRRWVAGGNRKPWRQKGTGRARQGSIRAPHWVGGGTVFGPQPRSYTQDIPRKARVLARRSALNARAAEGALLVIDAFQYEAPKTSRLVQLLARLDVAHRKVLILTDGVKPNVYLSARNLQNVRVLPFADVSTFHLLWSDVVLVESSALGDGLTPIAEGEVEKVKVRRGRTTDDGRQAADAGAEPAARAKKAPAKHAPRVAAKGTAAAREAKPAARHAAQKARGAAKKAAPKKKTKKKGK
jgi:large subunit ribosomal protein L4